MRLSITIPTGASIRSLISHASDDQQQLRDSFRYYSNGEVRMRELLMQDNSEIVEDQNSRKTSYSGSTELDIDSPRRKTRLSFEVHPILLFEESDDEYDSGAEVDSETEDDQMPSEAAEGIDDSTRIDNQGEALNLADLDSKLKTSFPFDPKEETMPRIVKNFPIEAQSNTDMEEFK